MNNPNNIAYRALKMLGVLIGFVGIAISSTLLTDLLIKELPLGVLVALVIMVAIGAAWLITE